jgi:HAMP domain-containing protein
MDWRGGGNLRETAPAIGESGRRLGPFILTVFFGIVFAAIVDLSWLTAGGTSGPWFSPAISVQVYTTTLTAATIATLIMASLAASRLAAFETRARAAAAREVANPTPSATIEVKVPETVVVAPPQAMRSEGLDQILSELHRFAERTNARVEDRTRRNEDRLARMVRQEANAVRDRTMSPAARDALQRGRGLVWQTVAGPLILFLAFISISGAMLPGSGAFAQAHFQLNTGLILFLSYAWPFLIAWAIASIALLQTLLRAQSAEGFGLGPRSRPERIQ